MTLQEFYTRIGGNYDDTLRRIPSEALVRKFVLKYPNDPSFGQLKDALAALGLTDAFDPDLADFSLLGDDPRGNYLSQVIHAARIEVNEEGTEAASATVVAAASGAAPPQEGVTLIFDRPFLYGIVDLQNGVPLFLGTFEGL